MTLDGTGTVAKELKTVALLCYMNWDCGASRWLQMIPLSTLNKSASFRIQHEEEHGTIVRIPMAWYGLQRSLCNLTDSKFS